MTPLEQLRKPDCHCCALHRSTTNICIMGRGYEHASVMVVGEAPGRAEAETGKPFMGASGKQLQAIIDSLGVEVYITNVAKCRPPQNRKPKVIEMKTCGSHYLDFEIMLVKPKVIVALGNTAMSYFSPLTKLPHGVLYSLKKPVAGIKLICTWHPAYGLRQGQWVFDEITETLKKANRYANLPKSV